VRTHDDEIRIDVAGDAQDRQLRRFIAPAAAGTCDAAYS